MLRSHLIEALEIMRSTPESQRGTAFEILGEFVKVTQAAEQVRANTLTMKNAEFVALVKLLRDYDLDPPMYYFRCSQHQYCLQQLRSSEMDGYIDSSRCYFDKNLKETGSNGSLDITLPQLRDMQANPADPEYMEPFSDIITFNFWNDTILLLVKADQSVETLQPLLVLCRSLVLSWQQASPEQWSQSLQDTTALAAWQNVLRACLGFIAHVSPIPGELGCTKADADFILSDPPKETPKKRRLIGHKRCPERAGR